MRVMLMVHTSVTFQSTSKSISPMPTQRDHYTCSMEMMGGEVIRSIGCLLMKQDTYSMLQMSTETVDALTKSTAKVLVLQRTEIVMSALEV